VISSGSLSFFLEGDGELGFAGGGGVDEGFAGAVSFGGLEGQAVLDAIWEAGKASFAVSVGAEFEVEFVKTAEAVGDVDFYFCGVDGSARGVSDGEVGGAGAGSAVEYGDGFGVGGGGLGEGWGGQGEHEEGQRGEGISTEHIHTD
jgi:hypothetical protein